MVYLFFVEKVQFEKKSADDTKKKIPSMQRNKQLDSTRSFQLISEHDHFLDSCENGKVIMKYWKQVINKSNY